MFETSETCETTEVLVQPLLVEVYAYREGNDVLFAHTWERQGNPKKRQGRIVIPFGDSDVPIHFNFHDRTEPSLHLSFFPDDRAIWVDVDYCPTAGPGNDLGQITYQMSGPTLLKIVNSNSKDCVLHFSLRFDGDPLGGQPPYEYDPEFRNGGH